MALLAKAFAKLGVETSFMVANYGQPATEVIDGVSLWNSLDFKKSFFSQVRQFYRTLKSVDADVYIQRTLSPYSSFIQRWCRKNNKLFVFMVAHDAEADGSHSVYRNFLFRFLSLSMFRHASLVVVQNEYEFAQIKKIRAGPILLLKKGLDFSVVKKKKKMYDCIWIGRCESWKRPEAFLQLAKSLPKKSFVMVCPPATNKDQYFLKIRTMASTIQNLKFIDYAENSQIYGLLASSKLFVLTSEQEGDWPSVVLEATVSGLPVVSLSLQYGGLIDEFQGGIVCNDSLTNLSANTRLLLEQQSQYKKASTGAKKYTTTNHEITKNASLFLKTIQSLSFGGKL